MEYKSFAEEEIHDDEDLSQSMYAGCDKLLGTTTPNCLFVSSEVDEEVHEHYYFLEANANHVERTGDLLLVEIDGTKFVLLDAGDSLIIIFDVKDKETVMEMF